jgi:hypothetical protein
MNQIIKTPSRIQQTIGHAIRWTFTIHPIKELVDRYVAEEKQGGYEEITLILPFHINKLAGFVTFEAFTCQ